MQRNTIGIELEPEELELLAKIGQETGKTINQLTIEAIRTTYNTTYESDRDRAIALLEAIAKIKGQVQQVLVAVEKQRCEIDLLSNRPKEDSQHSYPPRIVFIPSVD